MFFKNLLVYQLAEPFSWSAEELNEKLKTAPYQPCPRSENVSIGWVSPYGSDSELFVHSMKGFMLFAFCKEEKLLPATVIREELDKKIAELEQREDRVIYRKEKLDLKEQIILRLRSQAFSRKKITLGYIDEHSRYLLIDTASRNKAEEICSYLRKTLGSLKLALPVTNSQPESVMTSWLVKRHMPASFKIEHNCDMLDAKQKSGMIKCKDQDLISDEIISHLHSGKQIVKLALNWDDKLSFEFCDDLSIKRIRFLGLQTEREQAKKNSKQEQLDTDFAIMTGEFSMFLTHLWTLFDGLAPLETK